MRDLHPTTETAEGFHEAVSLSCAVLRQAFQAVYDANSDSLIIVGSTQNKHFDQVAQSTPCLPFKRRYDSCGFDRVLRPCTWWLYSSNPTVLRLARVCSALDDPDKRCDFTRTKHPRSTIWLRARGCSLEPLFCHALAAIVNEVVPPMST